MINQVLRNLATLLLLSVSLALSPQTWSMTEQEFDERVKTLEKKIAKAEKKSSKRARSLNSKFSKYLERLKINGFASAGLTTTDVDADHIIGINDTKNYQSDAIIAMQANFQVNDKTEAVLQLVGRGDQRNDVEAEWGYIAHSFTPNFIMRAGRLRVPYYTASEYLEVGFAYPWARPPVDVYNQAPLTSYFGADATFNFSAAGIDGVLQAFNGTTTLELDIANATLDKMYGIYLTLSKGPFSIRFGDTLAAISLNGDIALSPPAAVASSTDYTDFISDDTLAALITSQGIPFDTESQQYQAFLAYQLYINNTGLFDPNPLTGIPEAGAMLASAFDLQGLAVDFQSAGLNYDNGTWLVYLETTVARFSGDFSSMKSHYITAGRRMNKFLPYLHYAHAYTVEENLIASSIGTMIPTIVNGLGVTMTKQKTYSAGIRWDVMNGIALKLQVDHMTDLENTFGKFLTDPGSDIDLFSLVIDAVY